MAIKNIIKRGFGFSPGSVKFIPTHGFSIGAGTTFPFPTRITAQLNLTNIETVRV